jgi:hypothetical protein
MKIPVEISPENMATIRPVPLTTTLFTPVKASMMGVKMTPPPIPAITEIMAIAVLSRKKPKRITAMVALAISPELICPGITRDNNPNPAKDRITEAIMMMDSSQGD